MRAGLILAFALATLTGGIMATDLAQAAGGRVYIGTYTGGESKGVYACDFDADSGKLGPPRLVAETPNPSFLAFNAAGDRLYAVNEIGKFDGEPTGSVTAFAVDSADGSLEQLNAQPSGGRGPCFVTVTATDVLVANYGEGSVARLPLGEGGRLEAPSAVVQHHGASVDPKRQTGPHAHSINVDPTGRFAVAADLGLDQLLIYRVADDGSLPAHDPPFAAIEPGSGPRHLAFAPDGRFAYLINEMAGAVTVLAWDAEAGTLDTVQTISTAPEGVEEQSTAEILVHPTGRFVYGSNRNQHNIAVFAVDEATGRLTAVGHVPTGGRSPRNFAIDPTGRWLIAANGETGNLVVFRIDPRTGLPAPTGQTVEIDRPVCVRFPRPDR